MTRPAAGISRSDTGEAYVPQPHGGLLRRGGGRLEDPDVKKVKELLRAGSADAAQALLEKARNGDTKAIELVLAYGIGKPTDKVEVSGPEGGPIEYLAEMSDHEKRALRDAIRAHLEATPSAAR